MNEFEFKSIGIFSSCYKEKFGVPRQSNLVNKDNSKIILDLKYSQDSVRGLEKFSHIWVVFVFDKLPEGKKSQPLVRPPRLGGNEKVGVFASRSMFRPNKIGLSVLKLNSISTVSQQVILSVEGADLVDGTPILDIKPYISYSDSIIEADSAYANSPPELLNVIFSEQAKLDLKKKTHLNEHLAELITQILQQNPQPAYHKNDTLNGRIYAMKLYDFDLIWHICEEGIIEVLSLLSK